MITTRDRGPGSGPGGGRVPATRPQDVPDEGPGPGEHEPWSAVRRIGITLVVLAVLVLVGAGFLLLRAGEAAAQAGCPIRRSDSRPSAGPDDAHAPEATVHVRPS